MRLDLLSENELRPFFNCHFLSARALSKIIVPTSEKAAEVRSKYIAASLKRYRWLAENCEQICQRKGSAIKDVFELEYQVCHDMKTLLPAKIDRIHFFGENSLALI